MNALRSKQSKTQNNVTLLGAIQVRTPGLLHDTISCWEESPKLAQL